MRINRVAIVLIALIVVLLIPAFSEPALAVDPGAEVPGATITGFILDARGNCIPNATVKLLMDGQLFDIPGNPQQSSYVGGPYAWAGRYQFMRLPYGEYLITAGIPDAVGIVHGTNLSVAVNASTTTADLVISDLVIAVPTVPSPSPSATASPAPASFWGAGLALSLTGVCAYLIANRKNK